MSHGVIISCLSLVCQHSKSLKAYDLRVRIPVSPERCSPLLMSLLFPESVNYPSGFACPAEVQTDFADHSSPSAWGSPASVPTAWGHTSLISSPVSATQPWHHVGSSRCPRHPGPSGRVQRRQSLACSPGSLATLCRGLPGSQVDGGLQTLAALMP